jgi:hypothetical protein
LHVFRGRSGLYKARQNIQQRHYPFQPKQKIKN